MKGMSLALSFVLTAYFVNQAVPLRIDMRAMSRTLTASVIMAIVIVILEEIMYSVHLLLFYVVVGAAVYIAIIRVLRVLEKEDFQFLEQVMGKRTAKIISKILGGRD